MLIFGIILLVIGFIGKIFAQVGHITDSTTKAMGWIALGHFVNILSGILIGIGGLITLVAIFTIKMG